jgi:D-xylose transport system ATP-binding protein
VLTAKNLTKTFPGVVALRDVSFELRPGEIHALCGENGAGKSTLIKLLSGIHAHGSYEGELLVDGQPAMFSTIADAGRAGIAVIYQELALVPEMTVAENIFLGREPRRGLLVDNLQMLRETRELLSRFDVAVPPDASVASLGVGEKQLVEIVKALAKDSRVLILDEPTAALAEHEVRVLAAILRDLRARGIACIYISHKLDEVFALADRITVLRDGATIWTKATAETDKADVIRAMVGREIADLYPRRVTTPAAALVGARADSGETGPRSGERGYEIRSLTVADNDGRVRLRDVSFEVGAGEVLGIGGLMGAGRTELLMHLFGAWGTRVSGTVTLGDALLPPLPPHEILRRGIVLVSEDRRRYGLNLDESIGFNLSLSSIGKLTRGSLIDSGAEFAANDKQLRALRVKAPGLDAAVGKLSGGNQQKVVLGKALMTEPRVVLLDEPTRGIDVGAKVEIYELINVLTAAGKAVILVSSELPELIGMSDRIVMLHEGRVAGEFIRGATPEALLAAAMGHAGSTEAPRRA